VKTRQGFIAYNLLTTLVTVWQFTQLIPLSLYKPYNALALS